MHFTAIDQIPEKRWTRPTKKDLQKFLHDFDTSDSQVARVDVDWDEYASTESLCESLTRAVSRADLNIKVYKRGGYVYIKKV